MLEYIERGKTLKEWPLCDEPADAYQYIKSIPAADVRPVVRGRWIRNERGNYNCSNCKSEHNAVFGFIFCPNCGADMRKAIVEKKPLRLVTDRAGSAYCPTCGSYKTDYHVKTHSLDDTPQNFCSECGQGLIWDIDWKEA